MYAWQRRRCGARDDDLPLEEARGNLSGQYPRERGGCERPGRASKADPLRLPPYGRDSDRAARGSLRTDEGERLQPPHLVPHAAKGAVRVDWNGGIPDPGASLPDNVPAAEHVRLSLRVDLERREDDVARPRNRLDERVVLAREGRFGELDVVRDHARPVAAQDVDQPAVEVPRIGPMDLFAIRIPQPEREFVDPDDDHVMGLGLPAAEIE